jgi:NAD(P)-dependent dehydrogenase (short-subunit alcohol dehydrogenase family)
MNLQGKRVVICGGSSGIGLATARAAAAEGAPVVIVSSRQARVDEALASLPPNAEGHAVDLTNEAAVRAFFSRLGGFDHLVYTAGDQLQLGALKDTEIETARRFFDLRYWGAFMAAKYAAQKIRPGGSIVFSSGTAGRRPHPGWALGASICSAVEGLTRALAVELAPVRVNLVCPGFVKTPLWSGMPQEQRESMYAQAAARLPVGHVGEAEEIAEAYLYFMRASYSTGEVLVVDGGGVLV